MGKAKRSVRPVQPVRPVHFTEADAEEIEVEPLFYLPDPDDPDKEIEYTIPVEVPGQMTMAYLKDLRTMAPEQALSKMMDRILGPDAVDALATHPLVAGNSAGVAKIMKIVERKTTAAMEAIQGN